MPKFLVRAVTRLGHDGAWRAGRRWPSNADTEIEVLDQDDDPPADGKGLRVGKRTFEQLRKDPQLNVRTPGDPMTIAASMEDVPRLRAENERLRKRLAELEAQQGGGGGGEGEGSEGKRSRK